MCFGYLVHVDILFAAMYSRPWRVGRVVECTSLENWQAGNGLEGSNPSLSAKQ